MRRINLLLRAVIGLLIATLVISVTMGVVFRYGLGQSLYWATEVPNVLLIWIVFLGSVVAFYEKRHIAFEAVVGALPALPSRVTAVIAEIIVLGFLLFLTWYGWVIVTQAMSSPSDALKIPRGYFYLCVPLAGILMAMGSAANLYHLMMRRSAGEGR